MNDDPLGAGGQTVVYEATLSDASPPDRVAVRQLGDQGFEKSIEAQEASRFHNQIQKWETLSRRERTDPEWSNSDHIVGVVDTGNQLPWVALEYMDGGSLAERLDANSTRLPLEEAVWIGERLCRGLEVVHKSGIAHLDLKPMNILFRQTGPDTWNVPKIGDWGLAKLLLEHSKSVEELSPEYAAPEQFDPDEFGGTDKRTDIYQLGSIFYELFVGEPAFEGTAASVLRGKLDGEVTPPSRANPALPAALDDVLSRAMAVQKGDRYGSVIVFRNELRDLLDQL